jgi:hypothetical protein
VQDLAVQKYELFMQDPFHPSLGFQEKGKVWTVDIGRSHRAIAFRNGDQLTWFWIGSHEDYNRALRRVDRRRARRPRYIRAKRRLEAGATCPGTRGLRRG